MLSFFIVGLSQFTNALANTARFKISIDYKKIFAFLPRNKDYFFTDLKKHMKRVIL